MLVMPASFFGEKNFTFVTGARAVQAEIDAITLERGVAKGPRRRGGALGSCESLSGDLRSDPYAGGSLGTLSSLLTSLQQIDGRKAVVVMTDGLIHACRDEANAPERLRRLTEIANRSLKRMIGGISQKMLTQTVRALERDGLVRRQEFDEVPPRVEYSLTPLSRTLRGRHVWESPLHCRQHGCRSAGATHRTTVWHWGVRANTA